MRIFEKVLFTINSLSQFDAGMLAEGKIVIVIERTDKQVVCVCFCSCPCPSASISICFSVVRSLKKEDFLENSHVLSCFVRLKGVLFNPLSVWLLDWVMCSFQLYRPGRHCLSVDVERLKKNFMTN